jgi:hypothetical protein
MLFACLVVSQNALLQGVGRDCFGNARLVVFCALLARQRRRHLQRVVGAAGIAAGIRCNLLQCVFVSFDVQFAQPPLFVGQRALQQPDNLLFRQRVEHIHAAS